MRSETQPYSTVIAIRLCRTAHAIFFPKFWNFETNFNFTRVFVTVSPRRPWDRGWLQLDYIELCGIFICVVNIKLSSPILLIQVLHRSVVVRNQVMGLKNSH